MLLSTRTEVIWNSRNKKHYVDLGYHFTKMNDVFIARVCDLTQGSRAVVNIRCDYCGRRYSNEWHQYQHSRKKCVVQKDACVLCGELKATESIITKYGSCSEMNKQSDSKRRATNIQRYGSENVFGSDAIKQKIVDTNMKRYGVPYTQQNKDVRSKTVQTCNKRYGVDNYIELFKGSFIKENSPVWKGGVSYSRAERATYEYNAWRSAVFTRDHYTCAVCGIKNGTGVGEVELHAHHINNWADNPDIRYDTDNGITMCSSCHYRFHSRYGKRNNTREQLEEFSLIYKDLLDKKIC